MRRHILLSKLKDPGVTILLIKLLIIIPYLNTAVHATTGKTINELPSPFLVIPQPQRVEMLQGTGVDADGIHNLILQGIPERPVMGSILSRLTESGIEKGSLTLRLDSSNQSLPTTEEGYVLTILNGNAKIVTSDAAGLFYGCQTLEQLLEDARDFHIQVPACRITDYPAMAYRAVHFDVKHHLDHMNYYYESIDRLARYKINAIIFEFEDKLRYQRQPLVGAPQAISIDEMAALTKYARKRHIEISPLVQGLGHATFILKHEQYKYLRELPYNRWAFCPLNEGTYQVLFDQYRDAIEATPGSRYLHVGGDEVGNIGLCPRCKPTADKEGMLNLNLYWLKRVCGFAKENGRIPIFWDDMPLKEAGVYETTYMDNITREEVETAWKSGAQKLEEVIADFPKNCIYMRWNYSMASQPGNLMTLDWYQHHGLKFMVATAAQSGSVTLFPDDDRSGSMSAHGVAAIRNFIQLGITTKADGMLCTAWDDKSLHMETYWHGFVAAAEYSWSSGKRSLDQFDKAYLQREYGLNMPDYKTFYGKLKRAAEFWESTFIKKGKRTDLLNTLFNLPGLAHWLPARKPGTPLKTDFTDLLIGLPDKKNPGNWKKLYSDRLEEAAAILKEYDSTSKELNELYDQSKRNRYHWQVFSALNDFQITAPRLMLALEQCDTSDPVTWKLGVDAVENALTRFDLAWGNLKAIYSKTRFISYPVNYVPDRYFHFASQREDLTWMIQVEELFHKEIKQWMNN